METIEVDGFDLSGGNKSPDLKLGFAPGGYTFPVVCYPCDIVAYVLRKTFLWGHFPASPHHRQAAA